MLRSPSATQTSDEVAASVPSRRAPWWRRHRNALLLLLVLDLVFNYKIVWNFFDSVPRDPLDGSVFAWGFYNMAETLRHGGNPFTTQDIFYPVGSRLAFHAYAPLIGLLLTPLIWLFGLGIAMNVEVLLNTFIVGLSGYCLVNYLVRDRVAATFAGFVMMVLPLRFERETMHYNLSQLEFLVFGVLAILFLYERKSIKAAVLAGLVAGLSAGADFNLLFFVLMTYVTVAIVKWRTTFTKVMVLRLAISAGVCCLVASPLLVAAVGDLLRGETDPIVGWGGADFLGADPLSYLWPLGRHPWAPGTFLEVRESVLRMNSLLFPTFTVIALALWVLVKVKFSEKRTLVALLGVFFVLSLGPFLSIWGHTGGFFQYMGALFSVPLPYLAVTQIPVLEGIREPARFGYLVILLLAVLAGIGVAQLRKRFDPKKSLAVSLAAFSLVGFEAWPSSSVPDIAKDVKPAPYLAIKDDPGNLAVLEIPMQWGNGFFVVGDKDRKNGPLVYYATIHGKPTVAGYSGRYPQKRFQELWNIPVYSQILSLQGDKETQPVTFTAADLRAMGIGYVVTHADLPTPAATSYIESLDMPVLASDGTITAYKVP